MGEGKNNRSCQSREKPSLLLTLSYRKNNKDAVLVAVVFFLFFIHQNTDTETFFFLFLSDRGKRSKQLSPTFSHYNIRTTDTVKKGTTTNLLSALNGELKFFPFLMDQARGGGALSGVGGGREEGESLFEREGGAAL